MQLGERVYFVRCSSITLERIMQFFKYRRRVYIWTLMGMEAPILRPRGGAKILGKV
jgi:hypothetical protein